RVRYPRYLAPLVYNEGKSVGTAQRSQVSDYPFVPQKCPCLRWQASHGEGVRYVVVGKTHDETVVIHGGGEALRSAWDGSKIDDLPVLGPKDGSAHGEAHWVGKTVLRPPGDEPAITDPVGLTVRATRKQLQVSELAVVPYDGVFDKAVPPTAIGIERD